MNKQAFNEILNRSAQLINSDEFNYKVEQFSHSKNKASGKKNSVNEFNHLERQAFGDLIEEATAPTTAGEILFKGDKSSLPESIKEALGQRNIPVTQPMNTNTYMSSNNGIDYSLIKSLIDESIQRHLSSIKDELLNESKNTLKAFKFSNGNTVQFLDNKGNLYEAVLRLKKKKQ